MTAIDTQTDNPAPDAPAPASPQPPPQVAHPASHALLESWSRNEPMRHVPSIQWLTWKVDVDVRRTFEILHASFTRLSFDQPHRAELEQEWKLFCKAVDRLAETARHTRNNNHPPHDLGARIHAALNHAVQCLGSIDPQTFGRRFPVQTHERSKAEPLYGALLVVLSHVDRLEALTRLVDPGVDERLLDGLVKLTHPVNDEVLRPIA
jgi:hypothetical protein